MWDPVFGRTAVAAETDDRAWLRALCQVEAALARACAQAGLIPPGDAAAVGAACDALEATDPGALAERAAAGGNPVIPLVQDLRQQVAAAGGSAAAVHFGATSQDVLDSAMMLVCARALDVVVPSLRGCADACTALAAEHATTDMIGRTLLKQALPTTFGALTAVWRDGLQRATERLCAVRRELVVQLGGAAGTLEGYRGQGLAVRTGLAAELGLLEPGTVWHTERSRIGDLSGALGTTCGVLSKVAGDIVLLAQTELGEVAEGAPGGSSAMPHKRNAIAAITARAAAAQAPGLVATLLAAMSQELQRGAGGWHAEWTPLNALLTTTGGAAVRLHTSLTQLRVNPEAMARSLYGLPAYPTASGTP